MMKFTKMTYVVSVIFLILVLTSVHAEESKQVPESPSAEEIMQKYYSALYAPANDSRIEARLDLFDSAGKKRTRKLSIWRLNLNPDGTKQKVLMYFHEPPDVKGLSVMVWKYPARDDDRWMFIPALNLVRRLSARDYSQSFVGSDFTYEDGTGRDISLDLHKLLREEDINGSPNYVIETFPGSKAGWSRQVIWIDKNTFLPVKQEFYNSKNKLERVFTGSPAKMIRAKGSDHEFPTLVERKMKNLLTGHHSVFTFVSVEYNVGLSERNFTERYLKRPPRF